MQYAKKNYENMFTIQACLEFHTSTKLTATQIHSLGLREVERIEGEMLSIIRELGYSNLTLPQFTEQVRNDPANFYTSSEELLAAWKNIIEGKIQGKLGDLFHTLPSAKLEIVEVAH